MAKLPWVSRSAYEAAQTAGQTTVTALLAALDRERDRYQALVEKLTAMQRSGFTAPAATPDFQAPPRLAPEIDAAIAAHMDPRGPAGRKTAEIAQVWTAAGLPLVEIVRRIHHGAGEEAA